MMAHVRCYHWYLLGKQQNHDVRQHAGLGHGQHDRMELEDLLLLQQVVDLEQNDDMLEDGDAQVRVGLTLGNFNRCFIKIHWCEALSLQLLFEALMQE